MTSTTTLPVTSRWTPTTTSIWTINNVTQADIDDVEVTQATIVISWFMPWLLIGAGTVCNVLIILGMRTKNFRYLSTSVYMRAGAVNDCCSLLILMTAHWLHANFPQSIDRGPAGDAVCKFFNFYGWGQADLAIMLTSAMTADRAHVILKPATKADYRTRAKIVVGVCVGTCVVKNFHFWFYSEVTSVGRKDRLCDVQRSNSTYDAFYSRVWPYLDCAFDSLCFLVIVVSNSLIIVHVRRNRGGQLQVGGSTKRTINRAVNRTVNKTVNSAVDTAPSTGLSASTMTIHGKKHDKVLRQVTRMLLAESFLLILLSYPFSIYSIVASQTSHLLSDPAKRRANALVFNVVFYLQYANKCLNFTVYCMAGKRFRRAIVREVFCRYGRFHFGNTSRRFSESYNRSWRRQSTEMTQQNGESSGKSK